MSEEAKPPGRGLTPYERTASALERALPSIAKALPRHLTAERLGRMALNAIRKEPKLTQCDPLSVLSAVAEIAACGLEIGGPLGQAWLIPYKTECTPQLGYKGVAALAWRSGGIADISAEEVREGDEFEVRKGDEPRILHVPSRDPNRDIRPITDVYVVIATRQGGKIRHSMTRGQIQKHAERYSQAYKRKKADSPWMDPLGWIWMAKKTVLLQALKLVELSPEDRRLIESTEAELFREAPISGNERLKMLADLAATPEPGTAPLRSTVKTPPGDDSEAVEGEIIESDSDPECAAEPSKKGDQAFAELKAELGRAMRAEDVAAWSLLADKSKCVLTQAQWNQLYMAKVDQLALIADAEEADKAGR